MHGASCAWASGTLVCVGLNQTLELTSIHALCFTGTSKREHRAAPKLTTTKRQGENIGIDGTLPRFSLDIGPNRFWCCFGGPSFGGSFILQQRPKDKPSLKLPLTLLFGTNVLHLSHKSNSKRRWPAPYMRADICPLGSLHGFGKASIAPGVEYGSVHLGK